MNALQRRLVAGFDRVEAESRRPPVDTFVIPRWLEQACIKAGVSIPSDVVVLHGPPRYHQLHPDHRGP